MTGEIDICGVLAPPLLAWLGVALILSAALRWVLNRIGMYHYVWHRPLFDLCLLVILLGCVSILANHLS
jgi:hypothetical protein